MADFDTSSTAGTGLDFSTAAGELDEKQPLNFLGAVDEIEKSNASSMLNSARGKNPDHEAKVQQLSGKTGLPAPAVSRDTKAVEDQLNFNDAVSVLDKSPATRRFLSSAENVVVSNDSVLGLGVVEAAANSFKRGGTRVGAAYHQYAAEETAQQTLDTNRTFGDILDDVQTEPGLGKIGVVDPIDLANAAERWLNSRIFGGRAEEARYHYGEVGRLNRVIQETKMSDTATNFMNEVQQADGVLGKIAAVASNPLGMFAFSAEVGIEFVPQLVAGAGVTMTTRNPMYGAAAMGLLSGATERYASPQEFLSGVGVDLNDPAQVDALINNPDLMKAAQNYGFTRGAIIGTIDALSGGVASKALSQNPLSNMLLQTAVQGTFGGGGEAAAQLATKGEVDINEVIFEAIGEFATTPLEVAGVGGAYLRDKYNDTHKSAVSDANVETMDSVRDALQQSPLTERDPAKAAQHVADSFAEQGIYEVFIPVEALAEAAEASGDAAAFYEALGVTEQLEGAGVFNGDVRISVAKFSENVLQTDAYTTLRDNIRIDEDGLTQADKAEAEAYYEQDKKDFDAKAQVSRDTTPDEVDPASESHVQLAEHEMGLMALFNSAKEAGFTDTQFSTYVEAIKRSRDAGRRAKERAKLKRQAKRNEAKYKEQRPKVEADMKEHLSQEPKYQAMLSIGRDRLDYDKVLAIFNGDTGAMKALPLVNGQRIYGPKGVKGVSPDIVADMYGLQAGDIMLYDWVNSPSFDAEVQRLTDAKMEEMFPTLLTERQEIQEALQSLHTDDFADVLAYELNWMRTARKQKKLRLGLLKARAKQLVDGYKLSEINIRALEATQRREARRARTAVRAGDIDAAAKAKLNQLIAFQMTKEAYKIKGEVKTGNAFLRKFLTNRKMPSLPVEYRETIQEVLGRFQLGPKMSEQKRSDLMAWAQQQAEDNGVPVQIPQEIADADGKTNYQDMTLSEWRKLRDTVKGIEKEGRDINKLRDENERSTVQDIVNTIASGVAENLKAREVNVAKEVTEVTDVSAMSTVFRNIKEAKEKYGIDVSTILLNTDSILRNIDGFKSLGAAYKYIKGGIDRAITEGYRPGSLGQVARMKLESQRLQLLFDMYTKSERNMMWREVDIPGVRTRLSRMQRIGVLLHLGNEGGRTALLDSGQFTEAELAAVVDSLDKKDLDFAQAVWDYLDTFKGEIVGTVRRRQNRTPEMVEGSPLETRHGTYRGGYFPLMYDQEKAVLKDVAGVHTQEDVNDAIKLMLSGGFTASHTQDGYTETRKGSGGRPVMLDPRILNNHIQQLVYDLEVGDAVADAYKVLHHKDLKKAFTDVGQPQVWEALDVWLGDVVTGEIHHGAVVERTLRSIRTGTTVSALALNVGVAALQPLGLLQSSAMIGKRNTLAGLYDLMKNPLGMYKWVSSQSGFMAEREASFNKDIHDAQKGLTTGLLAKVTPGKTADYIADTFFYMIVKAQRFVDITTWLGALRQGKEMFNGDMEQAKRHADRMVARTQGSGNFQERTSFERGTTSRAVRNSELVRTWSLFLNYFAAKLNVAYERTKTTDFKNPIQVANYATDMALMFVVEGFLASVLKQGLPDDDEKDPWEQRVAWETFKTVAASFPIVRDAVADAEGFNTGGAAGSFAGKLSKAGKQISQAESDAQLYKSINSVFGTLFKYPAGQFNKTGQAILNEVSGEDVKAYEYLVGPAYKK